MEEVYLTQPNLVSELKRLAKDAEDYPEDMVFSLEFQFKGLDSRFMQIAERQNAAVALARQEKVKEQGNI